MNEEHSNFEVAESLPKPQPEKNSSTGFGGEFIVNPSETAQTIALEQGATGGTPPPVASQPHNGTPAQDFSQSGSISPANTPAIADDVDLIEKEWVEKAKEIVARTKSDPYAQNQEMNRVKADYLKKRYNKDVKISEV